MSLPYSLITSLLFSSLLFSLLDIVLPIVHSLGATHRCPSRLHRISQEYPSGDGQRTQHLLVLLGNERAVRLFLPSDAFQLSKQHGMFWEQFWGTFLSFHAAAHSA